MPLAVLEPVFGCQGSYGVGEGNDLKAEYSILKVLGHERAPRNLPLLPEEDQEQGPLRHVACNEERQAPRLHYVVVNSTALP